VNDKFQSFVKVLSRSGRNALAEKDIAELVAIRNGLADSMKAEILKK
jgi:hypothetical protein